MREVEEGDSFWAVVSDYQMEKLEVVYLGKSEKREQE